MMTRVDVDFMLDEELLASVDDSPVVPRVGERIAFPDSRLGTAIVRRVDWSIPVTSDNRRALSMVAIVVLERE